MRPVLLVALLAATAPAQPAHDWTIVPGQRVGPITAVTARGDLARLFPREAIEDDEIELDEGMLQSATLVYKKDPSQTLAISWNGGRLRQVFICWGLRRGACRWRVASGIGMGTKLAELEAMNGGPFTVSGFGYNYGGNVISWDAGRLAKLDCGGRLVLTMDGERSGGRYTVAMSPDELRAVRGDRPIASNTPAMRKLNPRVVGMLFQFAGPDSPKCQ